MTGILILARLGSSRLSNKHLLGASGKTFIEHLAGRFLKEFGKEINEEKCMLIIASSDEPANRKFEDIFRDTPVRVFYGNRHNIPLRQFECAGRYKLDFIISVDGDDILCSVHAARKIYECLNTGQAPAARTTGLPLGMNVSGYSSALLRKNLEKHPSARLETGWGRIFSGEKFAEFRMGEYDRDRSLRFTLDYPADADFFRTLIYAAGEKIIDIPDDELIKFVKDNHFNDINKSLDEEYWKNFERETREEKNG